MFCRKCGYPLVGDEKYCPSCGELVANTESEFSGERFERYDGKVFRCPYCGEVLDSFTDVCPSCGRELRGLAPSMSVSEMAAALRAAEAAEDRVTVIRSFPIPNSREDIIEFLTWSAANTNPGAYRLFSESKTRDADQAESEAWEAKLDQAYSKARIVFGGGDNKALESLESTYKETKKKLAYAKGSSTRFFAIFIALVVAGWIGLFALKACGLFD